MFNRHLAAGSANQQHVGAQRIHQIELPLEPVKGAGAFLPVPTFKIVEGFQKVDRQPQPLRHLRDVIGGAVKPGEIRLVEFHSGKARIRDDREFLLEITGDRRGRNCK